MFVEILCGTREYIEGSYIFCKTWMFFEKFTDYIFALVVGPR